MLIVYNDSIATSASSTSKSSLFPFSKESNRTHYNNAYAYFLETCNLNNIKAAFTTTKDLNSSRNFDSFWIYKNNSWKKSMQTCSAPLIFDKFSPKTKKQRQRRLDLFSSSNVKPFNSPKLFSLFFDKQKTFDKLSEYAIPTVSIDDKSEKGITKTFKKLAILLQNHPNKNDFSSDIVVKDRYGAGGNRIYKINSTDTVSKILDILETDKNQSFLLQPFTKFSKGYFKYNSLKGFVDIRIIFMGQNVIQTYIRTASGSDFRCNEHLGGSLEYINITEIPKKVINMSKKIALSVSKKNSLYALDFIISNNGNVYLMEGNTGPGLDWNSSIKKNVFEGKKLISEIVKELSSRMKLPHVIS
ncbi:hypothetical protein COW99_06025 [Candidatus Roizmanbacteria bacterium CG22_combo_CG10-13_8_21_14_all_38_20]|uniref:ATP-grasp domain-containing protein n=1 Tax=Candidatus Roizmanbacteria bacterium CG22_combo_CG10-13_8_21_14_all_38_20 TaxID=1974862 RepID=A0A2H0BU56_9BACT|nr:MAG: hypothetical protein COW99_06025 [Candidatus Roizmanbacteria bacterium CG22_combo_CG10-13_8_21_14_all_38_20]PJC30835.1 MAG: hypothetical protein CO050_04690 [Candidatus Roizmanbacteria bacterium CG_4_9_14_0_2_um_filter_38_17]